jgi:uncharacterized damage-inducible protein DinB
MLTSTAGAPPQVREDDLRMLAETLRKQYEHTGWATRRVLDAASALTPEQLHAPGTAGHGSIRDTFIHLMETQHGWLAWWDGSLSAEESYALKMDTAAFPDIPSLQAAWSKIERQTEAFVSGLSGADPERVYSMGLPDGRTWSMPLWGMMLHVANHGTQHRSEIAAMLTGFGHSPGDLDLLFFLQPPLDAPEGSDS